MITKGMFTSTTDEWETPQDLFDALDAVFHFTLDVCATADNAKCERYYTKEENGLKQTWDGVCWMNPPYGREIGKWVKKAYESGCVCVCSLQGLTQDGFMIMFWERLKYTLSKVGLNLATARTARRFPV